MIKAEQRKHRSILAKKENKEYEDLSEQIKINIAKGAKIYIPELVESLKKKYLPENDLTDEEIHERNKQIVRRIHQDWGNSRPWSDGMIGKCLPEEIQNPNLGIWKKNPELSRQILEKARETRAERKQLQQDIQKAFKKVENPSKEVIEEIKEEVRGEKITPDSGWKSTVTFGAKETVEDELDTPEQLHDDAMRAYAKIWAALANRDNLPSDSTDVFVDNIKASRNFRSRMLKGLAPDIRAGFINQTTWVQMLLTDLLKMDQELTKEEKHYGR